MTHALLLAAMVMIRTYSYVQVPAADMARARATADRTFEQAGISLQWVDCWAPADARSANAGRSAIVESPVCAKPLREGSDFVLRLVSSPATPNNPAARIVAMGTSFVDHDSGAGALTTVDPELVRKIARGSGADFATLLGRAIAHEIGHLLLGHSRHSRDGLMRAIWSQDEIRGIRAAGWLFSAAEAAEMRQALAARARSAN
jgi:hypothetical protein